MKIPDEYNTVFRLSFEDPELAKMDVRLRRSFGLMDSSGGLLSVDLDAVKAGRPKPEDFARLRALVDDFSGALVSWNLEDDDGQPLGTDRHTVRGLGDLFVLTLVSAFMDALREMGQGSLRQAASAAEVDEATLPVEPLSDDQVGDEAAGRDE